MKNFIGLIISLAIFCFFYFISCFFVELKYHIGWLSGAISVFILRYYYESVNKNM